MNYTGEISALITAFLWSVTAVSFELSAKKIGSELVNVMRLNIALLLLVSTIFIAGINYRISNLQIYYLALSGIVGLVFGDGFLFKALQKIGSRISMVIMSFTPVISAFLAFYFLGEVISIVNFLGIIMTLAGIYIVITDKKVNYENLSIKGRKRGILYAFLGALGQAVGLILAKEAFARGEINGFVATSYRIIAASIMLIPLYFLKRNNPRPLPTIRNNTEAIKFLLTGSVAGPFLGITFSLMAIAYTKVGIAATIMATVPVIMLPIAKYYLKEHIGSRAILGAIATVIGVGLLFLK